MKLNCTKINWLSRGIHFTRPNVVEIKKIGGLPQATARLFSEGRGGGTEPLFDLHNRRHDYLRVSVTERCNLRCQYCMPAEGVPLSPRERLLTRPELARLVRVFAAAGVSKLRLTGGEPTLRADLEDIVRDCAATPGIRSVGLTTNGVTLTRRLAGLQRAGLTHVNVSLDSLRAERWAQVSRRAAAGHARVLAALHLAEQLGYSPVKLNVVLLKGFNDDEIGDFVELTRDRDLEVRDSSKKSISVTSGLSPSPYGSGLNSTSRFIEFMPFTGNQWDDSRLVPARDVMRAALLAAPGLHAAPARPHDTARLYRAPTHRGAVGLISSMTQHFCASCNRLRLTADGNLKVCLFGAAEVSLATELRAGADDARLLRLVRGALRNKKPRHAGMRSLARSGDNRPMVLIGG